MTDELDDLLTEDFSALVEQYEHDGFQKEILFKLQRQQRARQGIVVLAGLIGAIIAALNISNVLDLFIPLMGVPEDITLPAGVDPQFISIVIIGGFTMALAFILKAE